MIRVLTYNGKDLGEFGVTADFSRVFKKPAYQVEKWLIPGKSGDIIKPEDRYENVEIVFDCIIRNHFRQNFPDLVDFLTSLQGGYARLENSAEPDVYRMAAFHSIIEPDTGQYLKSGRFSLIFDCQPQQFLKIGENPVTVTGGSTGTTISLRNPTFKPARPLIYISAMTDDGKITINGQEITILYSSYQIYIDCDTMHAYRLTGGTVVSFDSIVTMPDDFVQLIGGENTIEVKNMTVDIYPRWWRL